MATANAKELHIFCRKDRGTKDTMTIYVRRGNLVFYEAKFSSFSLYVKDDERELVEKYINNTDDAYKILELEKINNPTIEDLYSTEAMSSLERGQAGYWCYNALYNCEEYKEFLFWKRKVYTTILHSVLDGSPLVFKSRKPITFAKIQEKYGDKPLNTFELAKI